MKRYCGKAPVGNVRNGSPCDDDWRKAKAYCECNRETERERELLKRIDGLELELKGRNGAVEQRAARGSQDSVQERVQEWFDSANAKYERSKNALSAAQANYDRMVRELEQSKLDMDGAKRELDQAAGMLVAELNKLRNGQTRAGCRDAGEAPCEATTTVPTSGTGA
jgi:hypothetical protein